MSRSPNEVYEILSLTGHLMPPLPRDGELSLGHSYFRTLYHYSRTSWLLVQDLVKVCIIYEQLDADALFGFTLSEGIFEIEAIISTKKHAPSVVSWFPFSRVSFCHVHIPILPCLHSPMSKSAMSTPCSPMSHSAMSTSPFSHFSFCHVHTPILPCLILP